MGRPACLPFAPIDPPPELWSAGAMSVKEVGVFLSLSKREVQRLLARGALAHRRHGRRVLVSRRGVELWLRSENK